MYYAPAAAATQSTRWLQWRAEGCGRGSWTDDGSVGLEWRSAVRVVWFSRCGKGSAVAAGWRGTASGDGGGCRWFVVVRAGGGGGGGGGESVSGKRRRECACRKCSLREMTSSRRVPPSCVPRASTKHGRLLLLLLVVCWWCAGAGAAAAGGGGAIAARCLGWRVRRRCCRWKRLCTSSYPKAPLLLHVCERVNYFKVSEILWCIVDWNKIICLSISKIVYIFRLSLSILSISLTRSLFFFFSVYFMALMHFSCFVW